MRKINQLRQWLRQWDAGEYSFTAQMTSGHRQSMERPAEEAWTNQPIYSLERREIRAYQYLYPILAAVLCGAIIFFMLLTVSELPTFGAATIPVNNVVPQRYIEKGVQETGAVNFVAGMILDYRAFDTLGESHVPAKGISFFVCPAWVKFIG